MPTQPGPPSGHYPPQPPQPGPPSGYYPPQPPQNTTAPPWTTTKTLALASVCVGGVGFLVDFMFGMGIIFGAAGLIAGLVALNRAKKYNEPTPGLAKAGVIVSSVTVAFGFLWVILLVAGMSGM